MISSGTDRIAIRRALVSVYDKTGLEDLVRGLHDAGVELVSTGGSAALIEGLGIPVTKVEDLTGFPECLDGTGQDAAPEVHAGILADRRLDSHVAQLAELGVEPFDLVVSNLYPFTADRDLGRSPGRVRRADRHRRALDGARGRQEPPVGRDRHLAGEVRRRARGRGGRRVHARPAPGAGRGGLRPHRDVRRRSGVVDGQRAHRHVRRRRLPGLDGRDLGQAGRAAVRREPAPGRRALRRRLPAAARPRPGPSSCTARRCPTTTTSTPTRPTARPTTTATADRGDHQARQPVRDRGRRRRPSPRRTAGRTPATRCRRSAASSPTNRPVTREMADPVKDIFTEVIVAPASTRTRSRCYREEEPPAAAGRPARRRWGDAADLGRAAAPAA